MDTVDKLVAYCKEPKLKIFMLWGALENHLITIWVGTDPLPQDLVLQQNI